MQTPPQPPNHQTSQPIRTKLSNPGASSTAPRTPSVTSPTLSIRSSISKRSPSVSIRSRITNPISLYSCVAEECIAAAHNSIHTLVTASSDAPIRDFQKLIATGLTCLEATLQSGLLMPRQEARIRIRYAQILYEDTDNLMEAEMTLTKGLIVCDRHRFIDLKYIMQYLLLKILFHRSPKAAMVAADKNISDATATRHHQWAYVFRLLKASFYMQLGNPADVGAIENLRHLGTMAQEKSDFILCAFAYLLEALALLKTTKQENMHRIQECLAMATKNQLNQQQQLLQLDILILMVDLACSMRHKKTEIVASKLKALQDRMDEMQNSGGWHGSASLLFIPIKRQGSLAHISEDTASVISPGQTNEESDYIAFSFVTRVELMVLIMTFSGVAVSLQSATAPPKSLEFWKEAMETLDRWESDGVTQTQPTPTMQEALRRANWRAHIRCYLLVVSGLFAATHSRWSPVKESIKRLDILISPNDDSVVGLLALYLKGIYLQGTGDLEEALKVFSDPKYELDMVGGMRSTKLDIAVLATLNRIWILQHPDQPQSEDATNLLASLAPICTDHPDPEIRTVYNLVVATITTDPPQSLGQIKTSMHASIGGSKMTHNKHCLAIALNVMRSKLFEHVMGEQALKSAKAAAAQAKRGGNLLWVSVAEGMLAQSHEVMGQQKEAAAARELAANHASRALGN
ncbi:MAU2 chromatid cohesion factor -like protein [Ceratocystis fimbriata CBS 114723]|uniref:MAU2 chromatid cohesion factor-like protein n=1 Tax=Ceratocystis fimbriata CBS 114723 TaxID=1035309 RepID=A0A2C5X406_9PEZI|nr:MAU2 chromatid cohesion factor -like protein [Ceratocystis fimbriata CBS 114723]